MPSAAQTVAFDCTCFRPATSCPSSVQAAKQTVKTKKTDADIFEGAEAVVRPNALSHAGLADAPSASLADLLFFVQQADRALTGVLAYVLAIQPCVLESAKQQLLHKPPAVEL